MQNPGPHFLPILARAYMALCAGSNQFTLHLVPPLPQSGTQPVGVAFLEKTLTLKLLNIFFSYLKAFLFLWYLLFFLLFFVFVSVI